MGLKQGKGLGEHPVQTIAGIRALQEKYHGIQVKMSSLTCVPLMMRTKVAILTCMPIISQIISIAITLLLFYVKTAKCRPAIDRMS